tara:strand:- start:3061 stop:3225 length:165 start_codon:yes stop_codon:yes gene_type:complete
MTDLNPEQFDLMWLQFAALGAERERERIIELLEELHPDQDATQISVALIKGEQK